MVTRLGAYYAFWLPIALVVIVLEVLWRVTLLESLERRR